jgi:hypothetical protein
MIMPYRFRNASGQDGGVEKEEGLISQPLSDNMRKLRGERSIGGLRQEMAVAKIYIGTSTLHRADKGELGIRVESLEKIGQFFGVSAAQLLQPELGESAWPLTDIISPTDWGRLDSVVRKDILALVKTFVDRHRPEQVGSGKLSVSRDGAHQRGAL